MALNARTVIGMFSLYIPTRPIGMMTFFNWGTQLGKAPDGNTIELVIARPHRLDTDPRRYFADCKQFGIRLR
jgi:hypothetical protein